MRKDHSVVVREINRNSGGRVKYRADTAQRLGDSRKHKRHTGKLDKHPALCAYVERRWREDWSPEQIDGAIKERLSAELGGATISHESIYYWIYEKADKYKKLHIHLRTHRPRRRGRGGQKRRNVALPSRISIHERPTVIHEKKRVGDWESDTMEGMKRDKACVSVQYERAPQFIRLHKVANTSAAETDAAIRQTIDSLPLTLMQSITFDNGKESALHTTLRDDFNITTYHGDVYASWQKGGVENAIKLIRQYVPKHTPISQIPDEMLQAIEDRLNARPRKGLGYKTPNQVIHESGALKP